MLGMVTTTREKLHKFFKKPLPRFFFCIGLPIALLWICVSIVFYKIIEDWTWVQATFYSVNVFMGVGYGYPVLNSNHGKWFSIVHTALGSMCVNVILMFGFTFCLSPSSASSRMKIPSSPSLLSWIRFHSYRNRRRIAICVLCLLYVGVGAVFAMRPGNVVTERDENPLGSGFTNGVLFAVSSLSSVAQYAPVQKNSQMLLTCLYILFGTPLWACTLGMLGGIIFLHYQRVHRRAEARRKLESLSPEALRAMRKIRNERNGFSSSSQTSAIDYGTFLEYELQQLRLVDHKMLNILREKFMSSSKTMLQVLDSSKRLRKNETNTFDTYSSASDNDDDDDNRDDDDETLDHVPLLRRRTSSEDRNDEFSYLDDKNELNSIALLPGYLDDDCDEIEDENVSGLVGIEIENDGESLFQENDQLRYRSSTVQNL